MSEINQDMKNDQYKGSSGGRNLWIIGGIIAAVVILAIVWLLIPRGNRSNSSDDVKRMLAGSVSTDGSIHFVEADGSLTTLQKNAVAGYMTPDRKKAVILEKDGSLSYMDPSGENQKAIAEKVESISYVNDKGVLYNVISDEDKEAAYDDVIDAIVADNTKGYTKLQVEKAMKDSNYTGSVVFAKLLYNSVVGKAYEPEKLTYKYRYLYENEEGTKLTAGELERAYHSLDVLYESGGDVYFLDADGTEPEKIASYGTDSNVRVVGVADKGQFGVWTVEKGKEGAAYIMENKEADKIDTFAVGDANYPYQAAFSNQENGFVFINDHAKKAYVKYAGKEVIETKFPDDTKSMYLESSTGNGVYSSLDSNKFLVSSFYVREFKKLSSDYSSQYDLHYITQSGEREKVLTDFEEIIRIGDGLIYYIDAEKNLYSAKINGAELTDDNKISSDVKSAVVSSDGKHIYYLRDYNSKTTMGTLYYNEPGKDNVKIDDNVGLYSFTVSDDGKSVFYRSDVREIKDSYSDYGTLKLYNSKGENTKIADNVFVINSAVNGYVDPNNVVYGVYTKNTEKGYEYGYSYYNGKESKSLVEGLEREVDKKKN